jgi:hypothetical protein
VSRRALALLVVLGIAARAVAHWVAPEDVVAALNAPAARKATGVERAEQDPAAPRLLVIRVDASWYALPEGRRRSAAEEWLEHWRASVPQGVVSVLDARTDKPVVHFGRTGRVAGIAPGPPGVAPAPAP